MFKRVVLALAVTLAATIGTLAVADPASASVGGCTPSSIYSVCVNYGDSGGSIRADFYQNSRPGSDQVYYRVAIHIEQTNGGDFGYWVSGYLTIGSNGHYCCWYRNDTNLPEYYHGAKAVVYTFTASLVVHSVFTSPTVWYTS